MSDQFVPYQYDKPNTLPILTTKLYRPQVTADLEPRTELLERIDENRQRPLTLISAPAGYGKSTLASMWLEACGCPSAWVSLDEGDNDLRTFTSYLLAALSRTFPDSQPQTWNLLEAPVLPSMPTLARYLLNDLDQIAEPFILALDDVHMIHEQTVFDLLSELLRHPSPTLHLVLIARRDPPLPIASMRARGQITEVRSRDLRFTVPEAGRLLNRMLHEKYITSGNRPSFNNYFLTCPCKTLWICRITKFYIRIPNCKKLRKISFSIKQNADTHALLVFCVKQDSRYYAI